MPLVWSDDFNRAEQLNWSNGWFHDADEDYIEVSIDDSEGEVAALNTAEGYQQWIRLWNTSAGTLVDSEVSVDYRIISDNGGNAFQWGVLFRQNTDTNVDTSYRLVVDGRYSRLKIWKRVSGVSTLLAEKVLTVSHDTDNVQYRLKCSCVQDGSETELKIKFWRATDEEPEYTSSTNALTYTDNTAELQSYDGYVGLVLYSWGDAEEYIRFDNFSVSDFESEPEPVTGYVTFGNDATDKFADASPAFSLTDVTIEADAGASDDLAGVADSSESTWEDANDSSCKFMLLLNEGSGQTIKDVSSVAATGYLGTDASVETQDPAWVSGAGYEGGYALDFTRSQTDICRVGHNAAQISDALTVAARVILDALPSTGTAFIVTKDNPDGSARNWNLQYNSAGNWRFTYDNTSGTLVNVRYTVTPTIGTAYTVVATRSSDNVCTLYIDGVQVAQQTLSAPRTDATGPITIGGEGDATSDGCWDGKIDKVAMWNEVKDGNFISNLQPGTKYTLREGIAVAPVIAGTANNSIWTVTSTESTPAGGTIEYAFRASNEEFEEGDAAPNWTAWGDTSTVPQGKYLQWKVRFSGTLTGATVPRVTSISFNIQPGQDSGSVAYTPVKVWQASELTLPEWKIEVADTTGTKVLELTDVVNAKFNWDKRGGCGSFSFTLPDNPAEWQYLLPDYWVLLKVYNVDTYTWDTWYTGYLQRGPKYSKRSKEKTFSGVGFVGELEKKLITSLSVGRKSNNDNYLAVNTFATKVFDTWIDGKTNIKAISATWDASARVDEMSFENASLVEVMNTLTDSVDPSYAYGLGGTWGVDENRELFLHAVSDTPAHTLHHDDPRIEELDLEWDVSERLNEIMLTGGEANMVNLVSNPTFADVEVKSDGSVDYYDHFKGWVNSDTTNITFVDGFQMTPVRILHDNNFVHFSDNCTTGDYIETEPIETKGVWNGSNYSYCFSIGYWGMGRYYSGQGSYIDFDIGYCDTADGSYTWTSGDNLQWNSGEDYLIKTHIGETSFTHASDDLYLKVRVKPERAGREFWVDGIVCLIGNEKTKRGTPDDGVKYMMDNQYAGWFTNGTPTEVEKKQGEVSNQTLKTYLDASHYAEAFFSWYDREICGGTLVLRSYPYRVTPWEGSFKVVNIPKPDGTVETINFPVESVSLEASKTSWQLQVTIGDPIPREWTYIAKAWAKAKQAVKIIRQTKSKKHR